MSIKKSLLNGVSAVALTVVAAAPAGAVPVGNFLFGTSGNDVTVTDSLPVTAGALTSLSSQINNALNISTLVNSVTADGVIGIGIEAGSSTTGGPASASNNGFIALTVANQFTASSAAPNSAYVIDPNGIPANGYATVGTSQINLGMNNASATLGAIGQAGTSSTSTTSYSTLSGSGGTVSFAVSGSMATVTGNTSGLTTEDGQSLAIGATMSTTTMALLAGQSTPFVVDGSGYDTGLLSNPTSRSTNSFQVNGDVITTTSTTTTTVGAVTGGGNTVTFTNSDIYGAPVTLNSNTFAATVTGNLTSSAISGNLPAASVGGTSSHIATGTASAIITGVGTSSSGTNSPVGTAIATVAPISVTNVQQNIDPTSGTTMSANNYNSLVGATYTGGAGQAGGPVQTSLNTISSTAYGNSATLAVTLAGGNATEINSGVLVFNAQGNAGNFDVLASSASTMSVVSQVKNATIYAQAMSGIIGEGGSGSSNTALNQFHNSNVTANGNTIAAVARLNNVTQNLSTDGALIANGALGGSGTLVIAPGNNYSAASSTAGLSTSDATVTANANYVNFGYQHNLSNNPGNYAGEGGVQASSLNDNANIGIFGGMVNGAATIGGNTVQAMTTGNQASVTTTLARAVAGAASITGQYQSNTGGLDLSATVSAPSLMISDNQGLTTELTNPLYASVATAQSGSTYSNATLTIGSTSAGGGNAITAQVVGNNATATAAVNEAIPSGVLSTSVFSSTGIAPTNVSGATGTLTVLDPTTSVMVMQDNLNLGNLTTTVTSPGNLNYYGSVFQIDAVGVGGSGGLPGGSATIGYNTVNANSVGNLGAATATMTSGSNMLNGGVAVVTQQGNSNGVISATLDGFNGIAAVIDVGQAAQDTGIVGSNASIIGNSFGALALGNSAQGTLSLPSTAVAGGTLSGEVFAPITVDSTSSGTGLSVHANYLVGNVQTNLGVTFAATNAPVISTSNTTTTGMIIGAGMISNAGTVSVASNSLSTTTVGNEYGGSLTNYMAAASTSSGATSAAVASSQNNSGSTFTSTLGTTNFLVGLVSAPQEIQGGLLNDGSTTTSTSANSIIANSSVSVANNALSSIARGNSAALSMSGLGTSVSAGFEAGSGVGAEGNVGFNASNINSVGIYSAGVATLTNSQVNNYQNLSSSATTVSASVDVGMAGIVWANTSAASVTGSNLAVVGNTVSALAQGNTASQTAAIGGTGGSIYEAGLALVSGQYNVASDLGGISGATQSAFVSNQWFTNSGGTSAAPVTASQLHVDNNSVAASSTLNANIQSVTASAGSIVYGPTWGAVIAASGEGENGVQSGGAIVANNHQGNLGMASVAGTSNTTFSNAGTVFSDSTLTVNGNSVVSTAIGNTATTTAVLPLLDSNVMVGNSQVNGFSAVSATNFDTMLQNSAIAGSGASGTVALANTPVSVNNNLVSAVATVNNFAATISGLGQDGSSVNRYGNAFTGFSGPSVTASTDLGNAPYVGLVNAQSAMSQFALAATVNTTINISAQNVADAGFTVAQNSPLTVSGNTVTSQVSGNIASQTVNATGTGSSQIAGGISVANAQGNVGFGYSGVTSTTDITVVSATGPYPQTIANSPVTITSNTVGSQVTGNQSTQAMSFASAVNAGGAGVNPNASSISNATGNVAAYADYVLANSQTNSNGAIAALTDTTRIGYSGTAVQSPVNVNNNYVYAAAYGNNASMSMTAPLSTGSMQSSNFQGNNGVSISAAVTNTMVMANFAGGTTSNGAVNVNGNIVRAQAVGNVVGSTIKAN